MAIIHYWLVAMRGGEKVIEALLDIFPNADIYTNVYDYSAISRKINSHKIYNTYVKNLPNSKKYYQYYLPFMPHALKKLNLNKYDLVISSESGPAKGVVVPNSARHICYVHTPMRYIWDMYEIYLDNANWFKKILAPIIINRLREWDIHSANKVDYLIANSHYVSNRIKRYWGRDSTVIHPPVDINKFTVSGKIGNYYLMVGQLVHYKRTDLAVEAFNKSGMKLIIIGEGPELKRLKEIANSNILFLGWQPDKIVAEYYSKCKALIFPGIEDFGIIPVEAMASGRPVIAFRKGGALDTVISGKTGLFFSEQTPQNLNWIIKEFENKSNDFDPEIIRQHALNFDRKLFLKRFGNFVNNVMNL